MSEPELEEYEAKRDFNETTEPSPDDGSGAGDQATRFVIHEHDASSQHYDLRLEAGGVLKCWAVPKGPSTDPSERRLAVPTEDHPIEYLDFEGTIPEGEYGGGATLVWDTGDYRNDTVDDDGDEIPVPEAIERGHVVVCLEGEKLTGGYALTRTGEDGWILVKMHDGEADARRNPVSTEPESVKTGRSLDEMAAGEDES
jgi:DNA ligase D-like protein (predicted 3'-phosphoesterase)